MQKFHSNMRECGVVKRVEPGRETHNSHYTRTTVINEWTAISCEILDGVVTIRKMNIVSLNFL
jgi:hypothetical protein